MIIRPGNGLVVAALLLAWAGVTGCSKEVDPTNAQAPPAETKTGPAPEVTGTTPEPETGDWPWWRGPNLNAVATGPAAPTTWSESENIVWKTPVPGRGHSSPTLVGDRIFMATADEQAKAQSVVCFDRSTGKQNWITQVHSGGLPTSGMHPESSHASSTVACDGDRLYISFLNDGGVWATALTLDGEQVWQKRVGDFEPQFGYCPSPAIYKSLVIIAADHKGGGWLAGLQRDSGQIAWQTERPAVATYSSPAIGKVAGRDQLLIEGANLVASYDPNTGEELWKVAGTTDATCGTMNLAGDVVYASGGYPGSETLCVKADGSGTVVWRNKRKAYVPSMLLHDGRLYAMDGESGRMYCFDAASGEELWAGRMTPKFRASPVLSGDHIYLANARGTTYVFKATGSGLEIVSENTTGTEIYATPTICDGRIYLRAAAGNGNQRQETLYCIGTAGAE